VEFLLFWGENELAVVLISNASNAVSGSRGSGMVEGETHMSMSMSANPPGPVVEAYAVAWFVMRQMLSQSFPISAVMRHVVPIFDALSPLSD